MLLMLFLMLWFVCYDVVFDFVDVDAVDVEVVEVFVVVVKVVDVNVVEIVANYDVVPLFCSGAWKWIY